jgi:hypothetical protein
MNWDRLRNLEYTQVRIRPIAKRFTDEAGTQELRPIDGDWLIGRIYHKSVPINWAGFGVTLGHDHIHKLLQSLAAFRAQPVSRECLPLGISPAPQFGLSRNQAVPVSLAVRG